MYCQHCNQNEATTHIKRNINGKKEEMHLCSECAKELGVMDEFKMPSFSEFFGDSFIGNFLGSGVAAMNRLAEVERCSTCGSSFNDIVKSGHLGCDNCYDKFADKLTPSMQKLHGKANHIGKFVYYHEEDDDKGKQSKEPKKANELDDLKAKLQVAIDEQRFEDAAVLRDKINEIGESKND